MRGLIIEFVFTRFSSSTSRTQILLEHIFHMDALRSRGALIGLALAIFSYQSGVPTTFAFDRPVYLAIVVLSVALFLSVFTYLVLRYVDPPRLTYSTPVSASYTSLLPSSSNSWISTTRLQDFARQVAHDVRGVRLRESCDARTGIILSGLVLAVLVRTAVLASSMRNVTSAVPSLYILLPTAVSIIEPITHAAFVSQTTIEKRTVLNPRIVGLSVAVAFLGYYLQTQSLPGAHNYITTLLPSSLSTIIVQLIGFSIDAGLLSAVHIVLLQHRQRTDESAWIVIRNLSGWTAIVAFLSTTVLCLNAGAMYLSTPRERRWMYTIPPRFMADALSMSFKASFCIILLCTSMFFAGISSATLMATFTIVSTSVINMAWQTRNIETQTISSVFYFVYILFLLCAIVLQRFFYSPDRPHWMASAKPMPNITYGIMLTLFSLGMLVALSHQSASISIHPIARLMREAQVQHMTYLNNATSSKSLAEAVKEYQDRYHMPPPPHFDRWYKFADGRASLIVDAFDSIYHDLLPFWSISPEELRARTWRLVSSRRGIFGISLRNGDLTVAPGMPGTHRWMTDGIIQMIDEFSKGGNVPDLDMAFNMNDEPRAVVPYDIMQKNLALAREATGSVTTGMQQFSEGRAQGWKRFPAEDDFDPEKQNLKLFRGLAFKRTFYGASNVACPPWSAARTVRHWDIGRQCLQCSLPHSSGPYLADWNLSGDICHQPDLADLHGIFTSPAAMTLSSGIVPVFSQSKIAAYSDIRFPSPWNYLHKSQYNPTDEHPDMPWADKKQILFWRGSTTEGMCAYNQSQWRSMTRQRLTHLISPGENFDSPSQVVYLSDGMDHGDRHEYSQMSAKELSRYLDTDVEIVDIVRCLDEPDQLAQRELFIHDVKEEDRHIDFQAHWGYKYLLDLDGAGFSGRFLPFLKSGSLPFKSALFREWYDDRLTAWLHFVPIDLRGQGLWATLLYFAGINSDTKGVIKPVRAHDSEAESIAERGKEWAAQVLRKEDMQVYMFRLLLEWARLTDDRRDELGFTIHEET